MTSTLLLQLTLKALTDSPLTVQNIAGIPGASGGFDKPFSTLDLAKAIEGYLDDSRGFTVILAYPGDAGETYSSSSRKADWESAVLEVAAEMAEGTEDIHDGTEITILDVLEGSVGHATYAQADREAVVRFRGSHPILVARGKEPCQS